MLRTTPFVAALIVAAAFAVNCQVFFSTAASADLKAVWMAGQVFAEGRFDLVYPKDSAFYSMLPPPEWITRLRAAGDLQAVYPFIYPPLWAWLAAGLSKILSFEALTTAARVANVLMLLGMLAAARRLVAPAVPLAFYWLIGCGLLLLTTIGWVALAQNQPQILVAFLTVLAVERAETGHPRAAGMALALAASIKLYPALYALLWLASRNNRALASFAVAGGLLGGLSLAVAGWPLHQDFIRMIGVISSSALVTNICYAWESVIAQVFMSEHLINMHENVTNEAQGYALVWQVLPKPPLMALAFKIAQLLALLLAAMLFRASAPGPQRVALWPFAFGLFSMLGPIAWSYHYLSLLAFAPGLVLLMRPALAWLVLLLCALAMSPFILGLSGIMQLPWGSAFMETLATATLTLLTFAFLWASRHPSGEKQK